MDDVTRQREKIYGKGFGLKLHGKLTKFKPGDIFRFEVRHRLLSVYRNGTPFYWDDDDKLLLNFIKEDHHFAQVVRAILLPFGLTAKTKETQKAESTRNNYWYLEVITPNR